MVQIDHTISFLGGGDRTATFHQAAASTGLLQGTNKNPSPPVLHPDRVHTVAKSNTPSRNGIR